MSIPQGTPVDLLLRECVALNNHADMTAGRLDLTEKRDRYFMRTTVRRRQFGSEPWVPEVTQQWEHRVSIRMLRYIIIWGW